jgi:RNA polymerase sigma-70 factor, ECF subfamily
MVPDHEGTPTHICRSALVVLRSLSSLRWRAGPGKWGRLRSVRGVHHLGRAAQRDERLSRGEETFWRDLGDGGIELLMSRDEDVYLKYAPELLRFAASLVGPSMADDVLSSAFLHASSSRRWAVVEDQRAYLFRTVLNESRQHQRRDSRRLAREFIAARREPAPSTEATVELALALAELSPIERAVIFLTYWGGCTAAATALTLSLPKRSIERHLHHARTQLRKALQ